MFLRHLTASLCAVLAFSFCVPIAAQTDDAVAPPGIQYLTPVLVSPELQAQTDSELGVQAAIAGNARPGIPLWTYLVNSPRDGNFYTGVMVGKDPQIGGGSTVPVTVLPLILQTQSVSTSLDPRTGVFNTSPGITTFDMSKPDGACLSGDANVPLRLMLESPIFRPASFSIGGTSVGRVQYVDAFQRSNFWKITNTAGAPWDEDNGYHVKLGHPRVLPAVMLTIPADKGVAYSLTTMCSPVAIVDYAYFVSTLNTVVFPALAAAGVGPESLPIMAAGNVALTTGHQSIVGCCILGFHGAVGRTAPFQTFSYSAFYTNNFFGRASRDVAILSHEIGEWMDDPLISNRVPAYGHTGQVGGCSSILEVGDPLTGTEFSRIHMPNGFTYHLQELVNFSWFFGGSTVSLNDWYSDNATFVTDAGPLCTTGPPPPAGDSTPMTVIPSSE